MMDWSVYVQAAGPADDVPADEAAIDRFIENLASYSPAVTGTADPGRERTWSAQLALEDVDEPAKAAEWGLRAACEAAEKAGLPAWPIVKLEVTEWERFDAELDEPNTPDLVGVAELAELCGVTRQRASVLARRADFPEPLAELASGPVWDLRMVERFVRDWPRRPGRPATAATAASGTVIAAQKAFARSAKAAKAAKAAAFSVRNPRARGAKRTSAKRTQRD